MSHTTPKHPVLDRTEHFRSTVDRLQLDCLDTVWLGQLTPLRFVCSKGHVVVKSPLQIRRSLYPCSECLQDQLTGRLRAVARDAGVLWLNERWLGSRRYHQFCCASGHRWQRQGSRAMMSCACPVCAHRYATRLKGLQGLRKVAAQHGGKCLALSVESNHQRYSFCCVEGHTFELTGASVLSGSWCRQCRDNRKLSALAAELKKACEARGGVCLSATYPRSKGLHRFRCQAGHEWESLPSTVLRGGWCRRCSSEKTQTLEAAQEQARYYGGQCLSQVYINAQESLQWSCGFGHTWFASLAKVKSGSWCRECRKPTRSSWKRLAKFRVQNKG
jgi:hypothetical protein